MRRGASRPEATLGLLLAMAALKLPHMAQEVLPFGILFGTMLVFWRLTRSNELVVARAAGVSVWGFLAPAILVALLVGIVARAGLRPIVPPSRRVEPATPTPPSPRPDDAPREPAETPKS